MMMICIPNGIAFNPPMGSIRFISESWAKYHMSGRRMGLIIIKAIAFITENKPILMMLISTNIVIALLSKAIKKYYGLFLCLGIAILEDLGIGVMV